MVMTIIGLLFGIGIAQYTQFNRQQILDQAAQELKNNLRLAQTKASSGEKPNGCTTLAGYQVSFSSGTDNNPDTYRIQARCEPEGLVGEKSFSLPLMVRFSSPLPSSILFKVLAQGTNLNGDLTIDLEFTGTSLTRSVKVGKNGKIE